MTVAQGEKLLTIEEFSRLPDDDRPRELVRGKVVVMNPPKLRHGQVCMEIGRIYANEAKKKGLGHVLSNDAGVITERDPDTLRGADVQFFSYSRVPPGPLPEEYLDVTPDVVFEVLSPDDRWPKVEQKVAEYLNAGVAVVCVARPKTETVHVFRLNRPTLELSGDEELVLPEFSTDFRVRVEEFFA